MNLLNWVIFWIYLKKMFFFQEIHVSQAITDQGCSTFPYYKQNKKLLINSTWIAMILS